MKVQELTKIDILRIDMRAPCHSFSFILIIRWAKFHRNLWFTWPPLAQMVKKGSVKSAHRTLQYVKNDELDISRARLTQECNLTFYERCTTICRKSCSFQRCHPFSAPVGWKKVMAIFLCWEQRKSIFSNFCTNENCTVGFLVMKNLRNHIFSEKYPKFDAWHTK